jgi:SnoaL-like polyketide cyclase
MSSEQNKAIVRRLIEEPWKGDLRVIDELVDRKYVGYDPSVPEPLRGPDGFKENVSTYREAYSDARITVDEQIAEGDKVATRWTGRGKHDGDLMGIAPKKGRGSSGRLMHRPVRAGVGVGRGELGSSLYRLLVGRTRLIRVRSGGAVP